MQELNISILLKLTKECSMKSIVVTIASSYLIMLVLAILYSILNVVYLENQLSIMGGVVCLNTHLW